MFKINNTNIVLIIQARIGSSRLPKKMLLDLAGKTVIERVIERVKKVKYINKIVLAIPDTKENDDLEKIAFKNKIECFKGNENDLVDRYYQAALKYKADLVLRLPGDNPIPDPKEYEKLIKFHMNSNFDFSSNIMNFKNNGYPDGIGVEIFTFESLKYIWENVKNEFNREHVATNYYDYINDKYPNHTNFNIGTINCSSEIRRPNLCLDINTKSEYIFINKIFEYFKNSEFTTLDLINWYDNKYKKN